MVSDSPREERQVPVHNLKSAGATLHDDTVHNSGRLRLPYSFIEGQTWTSWNFVRSRLHTSEVDLTRDVVNIVAQRRAGTAVKHMLHLAFGRSQPAVTFPIQHTLLVPFISPDSQLLTNCKFDFWLVQAE